MHTHACTHARTHTHRCYLKLGNWRTQLEERQLTGEVISSILQFYKHATEYDRSWYKAWHAWAFMNFQALQDKQPTTGDLGVNSNNLRLLFVWAPGRWLPA